MSRVYIVTSGSYSDYSIDSVWSTREKADAEVERLSRSANGGYCPSEIEVEEYALDGDSDPAPLWRVSFQGDRGATCYRMEGRLNGKEQMFVGKHVFQRHGNYSCIVRGEDADAAIKVAAEKRASLLVKYAHLTERVGEWETIS